MAAFLDVCRFYPLSGGTGNFTYSSEVTGYVGPVVAGAADGMRYKYRAESADLSQWEVGEGIYTAATQTLSRTTILFSSSSGAKINFAAVPQVAIVALSGDLLSTAAANNWTAAQKLQARTNIGSIGVIKLRLFTSSITYTPDPYLIYARIECVGGGGGGGGVAGDASSLIVGGGGASGGYSMVHLSAASIGTSQDVTIGAGGAGGAMGANTGSTGGTTSFGTQVVANGGYGGGGMGLGILSGNGGSGSDTSTAVGSLHLSGTIGGPSFFLRSAQTIEIVAPLGYGANSLYGNGALGRLTNVSNIGANGGTGSGYGSGGGGAIVNQFVGNCSGGPGRQGICVVTEFCSQ